MLSSVPDSIDNPEPYGPAQHLSVVVPVYSGANYLLGLMDQLVALRDDLDSCDVPLKLTEVLFVDDESRDGSSQILREIEREHAMVTIVTMSRNFGQHPATIAGVLHTTGDWVVTLDEDGQHPPELIPMLLSTAVADELDVVYGYPADRAHSVFRDWASRTAKRTIGAVSGNRQLNLASSFRVIRGSVARGAASTASHQAYLDSGLSWFTNRATRVELDVTDPRAADGEESGYSFRRLLSHAHRGLVSGDMKVLRLLGGIGLVGVFGAFMLGSRFAYSWATGGLDRDTIGWPSTFAALLFFGGVLATQLVVLTEYTISSALHLRGKPAYFAVDRAVDAGLVAYFEANPPTTSSDGLGEADEPDRPAAAAA